MDPHAWPSEDADGDGGPPAWPSDDDDDDGDDGGPPT
jgi:hypothetical protein